MLKTLVKHQRPFVVFDPANEDHRRMYYKFLKTMSWRDCPYQWAIDDDSLDIVHSIQRKLIDHYTGLEFKKNVAKKPQKSAKIADKKVLKINDLQTRKKITK